MLEIIAKEQEKGSLVSVIVQFGGQTPLKLANGLRDLKRADPGHQRRRHRPGRRSQAFQEATGRPEPEAAARAAPP
ncbi:MAG: hypothetical protein U1E93_06045 [Alphaproteobacteria bacterium]